MGTNVIYLAELAVPSYRRHRVAASGASPAASSAWLTLARQRGSRKAAQSTQDQVEPAPASPVQRELALVPPAAATDQPRPDRPARQVTGPGPGLEIDVATKGQRARAAWTVEVRADRSPALRVTHLIDARQTPGASGRLRISGRMIDVCAELDRLAAAEAQAAPALRA